MAGALLFFAAMPEPGNSVMLWSGVVLGAVFAVASYVNIACFPIFVAILTGTLIRLFH